ncbi:MAG: tetratricopeptide repeat protein [Deltaproteobacteria bacterium]|nr:tetratricopeptide repeat protein [Deltaproteobacteria bacterium]
MTFFRSEILHGRFLILLALTTLFVFLPVSVSGSSGSEAEDEYHGFYVVSSYKNFDAAAALVDTLRAQGYDPFCKTVNIPKKGEWRHVFVKRYKNNGEALMAGKRLRRKGVIKSLIMMETPAVPPVPASAKKKLDSRNIKDVALLPDKEIMPADKNVVQPSPKEIVLPDKEDPDLEMVGKPHDGAMTDFTAGRYEDALGKFKEIIKTEKNETALRRIADCYYFLGEKGDNRYLSKAVDQYRNIIRNYPGSGKENAQAIYRLAVSYSRLNLYYEALIEFKNLCSKYSESDYIPESLYMMGKMYYRTKKFNEAIGKFKEYIKRFPAGIHVRAAYFSVGDCYSQMRQFRDADVWYGDALERWPALEDIPEDTLSNLGSHWFQVGKYDNALNIFFVYLNLFPDGKHCRNALYMIARSFEETGRLRSALKVLSLVVERYPGSREARRSALTMANIRVSYPEIKLPANIFPGMDYYSAPIEAYDKMAGKLSDLDMEEELVFRKGEALTKRGRHREAFDNYRLLLDKFPYGTYRKAGEKNLILSAGRLIDFWRRILILTEKFCSGEVILTCCSRSETA